MKAKTRHITKQDLLNILSTTNEQEINEIFESACELRNKRIGNKVYTRGLIEVSNICRKNCNYCGLRASNMQIDRYQITEPEILNTTKTASDNGFTSFVIQTGERSDKAFVDFISSLVFNMQHLGKQKLRITLSCGEQSLETYQKWRELGADRYLLRIESTNQKIYECIHPKNQFHSYERRIQALKDLKEAGFQVGSGIMIGIPGQTIEDIANDLIFLNEQAIDMVGMGPYLLHSETPMQSKKRELLSLKERYRLSLLTISALRMLMPDINIAAATALRYSGDTDPLIR